MSPYTYIEMCPSSSSMPVKIIRTRCVTFLTNFADLSLSHKMQQHRRPPLFIFFRIKPMHRPTIITTHIDRPHRRTFKQISFVQQPKSPKQSKMFKLVIEKINSKINYYLLIFCEKNPIHRLLPS